MCGILLAFSESPVDQERFNAARDAMLHRGPDAQSSTFLEEGTLALGHTRLSIIDLSSRANQPMQSGNLWVVFNGEIYNYPELRELLEKKGCRFVTTSDTEVLLHGYRVWGKELCSQLLGMFAFAIWDGDAKQILLGRDHFGQKPLYYSDVGGEFIVASEIKAIKAYTMRRLRMRRESIIDMLVQDFVPEPYSWYQDIKVLPAGHQMSVNRTPGGALNLRITEYWAFRPDPDPRPVSEADALNGLHEQVDCALRSHLLADVEVGAFLSGGIDSSAIVTLANGMLGHPIKTFSIGFGGDDELPIARETAALIGAEHQESEISEADFRSTLDTVLDVFDHPFTDTSLVPIGYVSQLAAQKVKVVLTGDGGDECFGGYDYGRYLGPGLVRRHGMDWKTSILSALDRCRWMVLGAERAAREAREHLVRARTVTEKRASLLNQDFGQDLADYDPAWAYRMYRRPNLDGFRDAQWVGIKVPLVNKMLVKVDRSSMRHSLETRAPFLSPRLVEYVLNLPRSVSNPKDDWFKGLFRRYLRGKLRADVLQGAKRGFSVPKTWKQIDSDRFLSDKELLPYCVEAEILRSGAWKEMKSLPKHMWRFMQVEQALASGGLEI